MQKITGTIEYTLIIDKNGVDIEYESTIENDLATLVISHRLMENVAVGMRNEKEVLSGKQKKWMSELLDKVVQGKFGLGRVVDYFLYNYEEYKKHQFIKYNNVSVTEGTLSPEQAAELLSKLKKNEEN